MTFAANIAPSSDGTPRQPDIFTVTAYRWGSLSEHQYEVGAFLDEAPALQCAEEARDDRGGKYGVTVRRWEAGECLLHKHFSSMAGEKAPYEDQRVEIFRRLAEEVADIVTSGVQHIADPEQKRPNIPVSVRVPSWLRQLVRDALFEAHYGDLCEEDMERNPIPPRSQLAKGELTKLLQERLQRLVPLAEAAVRKDFALGRELRKMALEPNAVPNASSSDKGADGE